MASHHSRALDFGLSSWRFAFLPKHPIHNDISLKKRANKGKIIDLGLVVFLTSRNFIITNIFCLNAEIEIILRAYSALR